MHLYTIGNRIQPVKGIGGYRGFEGSMVVKGYNDSWDTVNIVHGWIPGIHGRQRWQGIQGFDGYLGYRAFLDKRIYNIMGYIVFLD